MAKCRDCGVEIGFLPTPRGKWQAVDKDGGPHAASCSKRLANRPPAPPENECASCHSDNVEREPGKGPHFGGLRCHECGAFRWLRKPMETQA